MSQPSIRSCRSSLRNLAAAVFPGLLGLWIALALIKFGNPVILDSRIKWPATWLEALFQPWPVLLGYGMFGVVFLAGLSVWKWQVQEPLILVLLPAIWLGWQCLSALQTIDSKLTQATLPHFFVCVMAFYVGLFALSRVGSMRVFWLGVAGGWLVVTAIGWRQQFGGLEELREYFYALPNWREQSPELIAKIASNRIYSTLVYPNALAGVMVLFAPALAFGAWEGSSGYPRWIRLLLVGIPVAGALGCLVWSGSKGGWLIGFGLIILALWSRWGAAKGKGVAMILLLLVSAGGFWYRYSNYFERGATSVGARLDYWAVALSGAATRPLFGHGPGTFMRVYREGKPPEAEMTRLVHNDYLQQATDSGIPGAIFFSALVIGAMWVSYRRRNSALVRFGMWLGILGLACQSLSEFGLYIPALAWTWFLMMGFLLGPTGDLKTVDKTSPST